MLLELGRHAGFRGRHEQVPLSCHVGKLVVHDAAEEPGIVKYVRAEVPDRRAERLQGLI
jgi:hypothetical protein